MKSIQLKHRTVKVVSLVSNCYHLVSFFLTLYLHISVLNTVFLLLILYLPASVTDREREQTLCEIYDR